MYIICIYEYMGWVPGCLSARGRGHGHLPHCGGGVEVGGWGGKDSQTGQGFGKQTLNSNTRACEIVTENKHRPKIDTN